MKILFLICAVILSIDASSFNKSYMIDLYKSKQYKKVCRYGKKFIKYDKNIPLSLMADACAKEDDISILGIIVNNLYKTPKERMSASYFSTLILQKKLIYQFMNDDIDVSYLVLPKTDHVLSRVFENLSKGNYKRVKSKYGGKKIVIEDKEYKYNLYLPIGTAKRVFIFEYKNGKFLKKHWYR